MSAIFKVLTQQVEEDVAEMNGWIKHIQEGGLNGDFYADVHLQNISVEHNGNVMCVRTPFRYSTTLQVAFSLENDKKIVVQTWLTVDMNKSATPFTIESVQWDEDKQTYLPCINNERLTAAEVSRRALEPLFFLPERDRAVK